MATLIKSKRTRPKIIELEPEEPEPLAESVREQTDESRPLVNVLDDRNHESNRSADPTAPSQEDVDFTPTGLANDRERARFMQKVYLVLTAQKFTLFSLVSLFVFVPHLRKVFRKWVFDPLFLASWFISVPIVLFMGVLFIFPKMRRKFAKSTLVIITSCIALLVSYGLGNLTQKTAIAVLYSFGSSNLCDVGVVLASRGGLDFTKWRYISTVPIAMGVTSALAPTILHSSVNNTIWPSIIMTGLTSYLAVNTRPVIRHNDLGLEPHEYVFAAAQLYINPEQSIRHKLGNWCFGNGQQTGSRRSAYQEI